MRCSVAILNYAGIYRDAGLILQIENGLKLASAREPREVISALFDGPRSSPLSHPDVRWIEFDCECSGPFPRLTRQFLEVATGR
jgi:hypothetical protein